jgi:hypothetical protein
MCCSSGNWKALYRQVLHCVSVWNAKMYQTALSLLVLPYRRLTLFNWLWVTYNEWKLITARRKGCPNLAGKRQETGENWKLRSFMIRGLQRVLWKLRSQGGPNRPAVKGALWYEGVTECFTRKTWRKEALQKT